MNILKGIFEEIKKRMPGESIPKENQEHKLIYAVDNARKEWNYARDLFNQVDEPELVEHAIYAIEAAEKKYMYLLKEARNMGCRAYFSHMDNDHELTQI